MLKSKKFEEESVNEWKVADVTFHELVENDYDII